MSNQEYLDLSEMLKILTDAQSFIQFVDGRARWDGTGALNRAKELAELHPEKYIQWRAKRRLEGRKVIWRA